VHFEIGTIEPFLFFIYILENYFQNQKNHYTFWKQNPELLFTSSRLEVLDWWPLINEHGRFFQDPIGTISHITSNWIVGNTTLSLGIHVM